MEGICKILAMKNGIETIRILECLYGIEQDGRVLVEKWDKDCVYQAEVLWILGVGITCLKHHNVLGVVNAPSNHSPIQNYRHQV